LCGWEAWREGRKSVSRGEGTERRDGGEKSRGVAGKGKEEKERGVPVPYGKSFLDIQPL